MSEEENDDDDQEEDDDDYNDSEKSVDENDGPKWIQKRKLKTELKANKMSKTEESLSCQG